MNKFQRINDLLSVEGEEDSIIIEIICWIVLPCHVSFCGNILPSTFPLSFNVAILILYFILFHYLTSSKKVILVFVSKVHVI